MVNSSLLEAHAPYRYRCVQHLWPWLVLSNNGMAAMCDDIDQRTATVPNTSTPGISVATIEGIDGNLGPA